LGIMRVQVRDPIKTIIQRFSQQPGVNVPDHARRNLGIEGFGAGG
jgi:hypothetical protein